MASLSTILRLVTSNILLVHQIFCILKFLSSAFSTTVLSLFAMVIARNFRSLHYMHTLQLVTAYSLFVFCFLKLLNCLSQNVCRVFAVYLVFSF